MAGITPTATNDAASLIASQSQGFNPTALGEQGIIAGVNAIPVVGPALGQIGSAIFGVINAHHAQAVKREADALNKAVPSFMATLQAILGAFTQGQVNAVDAGNYIDGIVADYYTMVSGNGSGYIEGHWAGVTFPFATSDPVGENHEVKPSKCNGPCVVGHFIEELATGAKRAMQLVESGGTESFNHFPVAYQIANGKGVFICHTFPSHAGFGGFAQWQISLSVSPIAELLPASVVSAINTILPASLQGHLGLVAGIVVGFFGLIFLTARAASR
jgi:hypothetical protein